MTVSFDEQSLSSDHSCERCSYFVNRELDVFQSLPELEQSLSKEVQMASVYIAGYVAKKCLLQIIHILMLMNMELTSNN